jgi:hypothetical protein
MLVSNSRFLTRILYMTLISCLATCPVLCGECYLGLKHRGNLSDGCYRFGGAYCFCLQELVDLKFREGDCKTLLEHIFQELTNICLTGFAGYVSACVQLYCVGLHCFSLHDSAYMAIFKRRINYLYMLEGLCFAVLFCLFFHVVTLCTFPFVFFLCRVQSAEKSNEAESFKHMKIKYPTYLKMAM